MSEKERNELLAAGKCFKCKEPGHLARNCPHSTFVKSDKSGKAPGLPSYKIGIDLAEVDELRELADTTKELHDIPCRAISFDLDKDPYLENFEESFPIMGDAPALIAEAQLQHAQPYLGDDLEEPVMEDHRFELVRIPEKENVYLINDLRHDSFDDPAGYSIEINKEQLLDPEFNCPKWYADQLVKKLFPHVPQSNAQDYHPRIYDFCMTDVYLDMLACQLKLAVHIFPAPINQPDDEQEALSRFRFERWEHTCFIIDYGEHTLTEISVDLLAKPQFRILQWYEKHIIEKRRARKIVQPAYFSSKVV
jgi:Zinc knuckle